MRLARAFAGILACLLLQGLLVPAQALTLRLPPDITGPNTGGFEIPLYGENEEITRIFRAPDGHLILAFDYRSSQGTVSDLYDTTTRQRAYPDLERKAATDNAVERDYAQTHDLTALPFSVGPTPDGKEVMGGYAGGRICDNPYMTQFQGPNFEFQLFQKRPAPARVILDSDCGVGPVTYRYQDRYAICYANDLGFFMKIDRFLIWFDWNGHTNFLNGRDDYVVVPVEALNPVYATDTKEDGQAYRADTIRKVDAIIAQYGARQLKAKKHD
jgi:hypothetical protein